MTFHMPDSYYSQPEPVAEFETTLYCDYCENDTEQSCWQWFRGGPIHGSCSVCESENEHLLTEEPDDR